MTTSLSGTFKIELPHVDELNTKFNAISGSVTTLQKQVDILNSELLSNVQNLQKEIVLTHTALDQAKTTASAAITSMNQQVSQLAGELAGVNTTLTTLAAAVNSLATGSQTISTSGTTTSGSTVSGTTSGSASSGTTASGIPAGTATSGTSGTSGSTAPTTSGTGTSGSSVSGNINLATGLTNHGIALMPYSKLAKPAKGQTVIDPDFGTKITRITDGITDFKSDVVVPAYPTAMAWNCNETRFILYVTNNATSGQQGWAMYDGTSYAFIKFLDINPADVEQFYWDHQDPAILRYIDNHQMGSQMLADLTEINVETGVKTITHSFLAPGGLPAGFPTAGPVRCGYPFALGINALGQRIWGLGAGGVPNVAGELGLQVFGFNEATKAFILYDTSVIPQPQARGSTPFPSLSGRYFIWNSAASQGLNSTPTTRSAIMDATTGKLVRWVEFDTNEHCDNAMSATGEDLLVGSQFSRNTGGNGNVIVANLDTGALHNWVGESSSPIFGYPATGSLSGATAWKNPNWVVTGMTGNIYGTGNNGPTANPKTLLDQEVMLTNLDSGESYRIAHHRSTGNWNNAPQSNYWAQTNVTFSVSGTRILVQSDWGCADPANPTLNPNAPVDTYVIELPSFA